MSQRKVIMIFVIVMIVLLAGVSAFFVCDMYLDRDLDITTHQIVADIKDTVMPSDFADEYNADNVSIEFKSTPINKEGTQEVILVVTNRSGKSKEYTEMLTYTKTDVIPPVISGVMDISIHTGDTISYMNGVSAVDDEDGEVDVIVDKSSVNTRKEGLYNITYSATDLSGNTAMVQAVVEVSDITATQKQLYELADSVIARITTDDMSIGEKAYAIFNYVHENVGYTGTRLADDWDMEAYMALTNIEDKGSSGGDCHTYFAASKVLLERIGAELMPVERLNAQEGNRHYWLLCNLGTGWYHFDATRIRGGFTCFMLTDAQVRSFTDVQKDFYSFDESAYPSTPTTDFVLE